MATFEMIWPLCGRSVAPIAILFNLTAWHLKSSSGAMDACREHTKFIKIHIKMMNKTSEEEIHNFVVFFVVRVCVLMLIHFPNRKMHAAKS